MNSNELYEYCKNNEYAREYVENDIIDPLWMVLRTMIDGGKDIQAFEPDISKISVYFWATLTAKCHVTVTPYEIQRMIFEHIFPEIEQEFKRRIQDDPNELAICINGSEVLMLYGNHNLVSAARSDYFSKGIHAFD